MHNDLQKKNTDIIAEIKDRLDIVDVVSEQVVLKKSGRNFWGCCPFHKEKTPSFSVNPEKGIYKCFGCGEGGDAISFLMKTGNKSFYEVMSEQAQRFGLELPSFQHSAEKTELKKQIYDINQKSSEYFTNLLLNSDEAQKVREYLLKRGIDGQSIKKFGLGFAPAKQDGLINHLVDNYKSKFDFLETAGLISRKSTSNGFVDRFRNRLMIPVIDEKGNIVAFGARALEDSQQPKYLNSPETPAYNKSRVLYGLYYAKDSIRELDQVIIMEGYFDVITAHINGITNVVASSGTALSEQQLKLLARYTDSRKIYLAFDADNAGIAAAERGAEIIKSTFGSLGDIKQFDESFTSGISHDKFSCEIRVISTNAGKDPDEFIRTEGVEAYKKCINNAPLLIDYQINRIIKTKDQIKTPQDKLNIVKQLMPVFAEMQNAIARNEYIKLMAARLEIEEKSLFTEINKVIGGVRQKEPELQRIVKKTSKKVNLAQKNLLSLYLICSEEIPISFLNNQIKEVQFTDPVFALIKQEIENLSEEVVNAKELTDKLFLNLSDNEEAKQILADMIFSLDDKIGLSAKLLREYIRENIDCINNYQKESELKRLKSDYHTAKTDEISSLQLQYEVRERLKNNNRLELLNEQKI